jgi:hypothetical protein
MRLKLRLGHLRKRQRSKEKVMKPKLYTISAGFQSDPWRSKSKTGQLAVLAKVWFNRPTLKYAVVKILLNRHINFVIEEHWHLHWIVQYYNITLMPFTFLSSSTDTFQLLIQLSRCFQNVETPISSRFYPSTGTHQTTPLISSNPNFILTQAKKSHSYSTAQIRTENCRIPGVHAVWFVSNMLRS